MKHRLFGLLATTIACFALLDEARAQANLPPGPSNYEHDLQVFAPFDLDLDNMVDDQWSGYFFEYNKLFWAYTGERTTIGSPNVTETVDGVLVNAVFAEIIYRDNPQDEGDPPPPHLVRNSLTNVAPKAGFALGDRYELGYRDNGHGWQIGVLDGPQLHQREFYGFAPRGQMAVCRRSSTTITPTATDIGPGTGPVNDFRAFGFGSVPILFETPPGYLFGFRDYLNILADASIGTQGGPMLYVGNYGGIAENDDVPIDFFRLADDLDEDGIAGSGVDRGRRWQHRPALHRLRRPARVQHLL